LGWTAGSLMTLLPSRMVWSKLVNCLAHAAVLIQRLSWQVLTGISLPPKATTKRKQKAEIGATDCGKPPEATSKPHQSVLIANPLRPQSLPKAWARLV
jgi:hypothetical protein